jgi:hypothetical protein
VHFTGPKQLPQEPIHDRSQVIPNPQVLFPTILVPTNEQISLIASTKRCLIPHQTPPRLPLTLHPPSLLPRPPPLNCHPHLLRLTTNRSPLPLRIPPHRFILQKMAPIKHHQSLARGELEPMIWTHTIAGTLGLPINGLVQFGICKAFTTILFRSPQRSVSGEGHLNGNFPPPKEASTRNRLLIYTNTPIQINSETLVTPAITEDILSYIKYNYYVIS